MDVKTLGPGVSYVTGNGNYLLNREERVNKDYYSCAKKLDTKFNGTLAGDIGPVQQKLLSFGKDGRVIGLVFGAFGEASRNVHALIDFIASRYADISSRSIDPEYNSWAELKAKKKIYLSMEWGLLVHRGWARMLRDRLALLVHSNRNEEIIITQVEGDEDG